MRGARQNNLQDVDVDIPRNRLVAITGVSGSGKSSLAFDTLFREGQRRFLETLSAYARQFLGRMEKPDVDSIEGLSPAIAVDQRAIQRGPRSTVGTLTEIVDHLRVLYARAGTAHCPEHARALEGQTPEAVVRQVVERFEGRAVVVLAPLVRDRKGHHRALFADLVKRGFVRARVDGNVHRLEDVPELERYKRHTIEVVVDRLRVKAEALPRVREAVQGAVELGKGDLVVADESGDDHAYSTLRSCPECGLEAPPLEPRLFTFNSPHGACSDCDGLGLLRAPSTRKVVRDPALSIAAGALAVTRADGGGLLFPRVDMSFLAAVGEAKGFDLKTPWRNLSASAKRTVLHGAGQARFADTSSWNGKRYQGSVRWERRYKGVLPALEKAWRTGGRRKQVERFLDVETCRSCDGSRLNAHANAVTVGGRGLGTLTRLPVDDLPALLNSLEFTKRERAIAAELLVEIQRRLAFLQQVGLGYLSLDRGADTLSGGEAQRIRLAAQLGAGLQGVLYVLDEPSIGLHPRDHGRLLEALRALRDAGNTVVVVEHDEATLRAADYLIDVGPGAGRDGGAIVLAGRPEEVARGNSPTAQLLRGELPMPVPEERRTGNGNYLELRGAAGFNLTGVDVRWPLGTLAVVTGVSGSGKSTLVESTLRRAVERHLGREVREPEENDGIEGLEHVEDIVAIDATPIGRTPRSNPATYSGAFTPIRDLFASLPEARMHGWEAGRFSFNVAGGRCESCQGAGAKLIELQFLAPVTIPCDECGGRRFQAETLEARYRGRNIADVLDLTIEEAEQLFGDHPKIARPLRALLEVGLGYISLGQPSTTLSGGEAQRVKLAKHLQRRSRKHTLYLLDEPTTGLHQKDVQRLVGALQALVDLGHSVLVVEHNLDVVRAADHVVDLGPEGGRGGGRVIAIGTPEEIAACEASRTGAALRAEAAPLGGAGDAVDLLPPAPAVRDTLSVRGARIHNLKNVDVDIPHNALTVITGPSGSGKSSLALDTIHEAGRQRFVESLSTYSRQFLGARGQPPVDRIDGLGPSVSVEARNSGGHPRSTVATTTELHDHMRVLWSRAGTRRCPDHGIRLEPADPSVLARRIASDADGQKGWIVAPMFGPGIAAVTQAALTSAVEAWRAEGYVRCLIDGEEQRLDAVAAAGLADDARVDLVIDRLSFGAETRRRIAEAVEQAAGASGGRVAVLLRVRGSAPRRADYHTHGACTECGFHLDSELEPRHFSFNTHVGACPRCDGLGSSWCCDPERLVDHPELPLVASESGQPTAVSGKLGRYLTKGKGYYEYLLRTVAAEHRIDLARPFGKLNAAQRELLLFGKGAREGYSVEIEKHGSHYDLEETFEAPWPGLCGHVDAWHKKSEDPEWRGVLEKSMSRTTCPDCQGERLGAAQRAVLVGRKRLPEVLALPVGEVALWLGKLKLRKGLAQAVQPVVDELRSRLSLLERVGLDYLTLDRSMATLSGGEARRVRLSANLGSQLVGVCYVLDEPTVGLHPADIERLTGALLGLRDGGNTVLVVEHDESLMERADHIVDVGPAAGRLGGEIVATGTPDEIRAHPTSLTGQALRGELALPQAVPPRSKSDPVGVRGARLHNLQGATFEARFGELTGVCGPSGSGKSSLVIDCFVPAIQGERAGGRWRSTIGMAGGGRRVVVVDASPLGRTPASIPATVVGLMGPLRELYARTPEARARGYTGSHFSFNSTRGRCPACEGKGHTRVEMQFLADLWIECEECDGRRYAPAVLEVPYRGRSIAEALALTVDEACETFEHQPALIQPLETLQRVGLGYLTLSQSSTTLSAGEAQRVKLASELMRAEGTGRSIVVLDEPSTGLHASDVVQLARVLQELAARGDAVVVIEHHVGLLGACHRLVELGPGGGRAGGRVIAQGTPAELARDADSITGPWLELKTKGRSKRKKPRAKKVATRKVPL